MPVYRIKFSKRAKRDLKKLDPDVRRQIRDDINTLSHDPRPQSSKQMKGEYKGFWRERTGLSHYL